MRPPRSHSFPNHPRPRIKRLEWSKYVTIAVGFVCTNGTLLAADTKESYPDSQHTYVNKVCPFDSGDLDGALVGAGDAAI